MKKLWVIIISVILVAALSFGAWALWTNISSNEQSNTKPLSVYYISTGGKLAGDKIGCGDSIVSNDTSPIKTSDRVKSAFERLLSNKGQFVGQSKLYNALYQSNLKYESSETKDGILVVELSGELKLAGECDDKRVMAQLVYTAKGNIDGLPLVVIMLNDKPLKNILSQK